MPLRCFRNTPGGEFPGRIAETAKLGLNTKKGQALAISQINKIQKKRYVYYSCTNAKKVCKRVYVKEETLVKTLSGYLDQIALSQEQIGAGTQYLKEIHESETQFHTESLTALQKERDKIQKRLAQIYDDKLDGLIDEKLYLGKCMNTKPASLKLLRK